MFKLRVLFLLFIVLLVLFIYQNNAIFAKSNFKKFLIKNNKEKLLKVNFLNIGQGDSILVQSPFGQNILIDGGDGEKIIQEIESVLPFWDRKIDLMVLTHPHSDHIGGLIKVLKKYQVKKVIYTGVLHTSPEYLEWLKIIRNKKIPLSLITHQQKIILGKNIYFEILYPRKSLVNQSVDNLNNTSIVLKLNFNKISFLFTGDIEQETEKEILNQNISAKILKIAHHGSKTSSIDDFLDKVNPLLAIIQSGKNNPFGHPHLEVIKRLERKGIKILRNDKEGRIIIQTNGVDFSIE